MSNLLKTPLRMQAKTMALILPLALLISGMLAVATSGNSAALWIVVPAVLALGLRHAFDADHITSIDNVVRSLRESGKPAHLVGFFFSSGHSVVVLTAMLMVVMAGSVFDSSSADAVTAFSGLFVAVFLTAIIAVNIVFVSRQKNGPIGPMFILFRKLVAKISSQWQMLIVGFLFGLGLDTAVSLIGLAAAGALLNDLSIVGGIGLALLFAGAMGTGDSINTILVNSVYAKGISGGKNANAYQNILTIVVISVAAFVAVPLWLEIAGVALPGVGYWLDNAGYLLVLITLLLLLAVFLFNRKNVAIK